MSQQIEIDDYEALYDAVREAHNSGDMFFSRPTLFIDLKFSTNGEASRKSVRLSKFNIEVEHNNKLHIDCNHPSVQIFIDVEDYLFRIRLDGDVRFTNNILILNFNGDSFFYQNETGITFRNFHEDDDCYLFSNTIYYLQLISFLKEQENKEDHNFYFVDYFNKDHRRIIVTSSVKQGKLTIGYKQEIPDFPVDKSIGPPIEQFQEAFKQKEFPRFIKSELFNILPSCLDKEHRLEFFIIHLPVILERAEQNFEIYLSDLSLDNFKKQYLDFRIKYFGLFRDILSKLTTQVLAFPISITAAAFATYRVNDDEYLSYSIVAAFVIFGVYSLFMLGAYKQDVVENNSLFKKEYDELSQNQFFIRYPKELTYFTSTKKFVDNRYKFLNSSLLIYSIVLSATNSLFAFFILNQFKSLLVSVIAFIVLVSSVIIIIIQLFPDAFKKESEKNAS